LAELAGFSDVGSLAPLVTAGGSDDQLRLDTWNFVVKGIESEACLAGLEFEEALSEGFEG
jgi:hypothetical protein